MANVEEVDIDSLLADVGIDTSDANDMQESATGNDIGAGIQIEEYVPQKPIPTSVAKIASKKTASVGKDIHEVDLTKTCFAKIEKVLNDTSSGIFDDPAYYKTAMKDEGQAATRLHALLSKYLPCTDPKDKTVYRQQIISAYWEYLRSLAPKMCDLSLPMPKRMAMRFGVILPSLFTQEQKDFFSRAKIENDTGEPVLYLDEWFKEVSAGRLGLSVTDEGRPQRKDGGAETQRLMALQSKNAGKMQSAEGLLNVKENERRMLEIELKRNIDGLCIHHPCPGFEPHTMPYTQSQVPIFAQIIAQLKALQKNNKELNGCLNEYQEAKEVAESLAQKMSEAPEGSDVSSSDISTEMQTARQMAKMTVGRQGNHFPIFTREFFHNTAIGTGFRENVINTLAWVESLDPGCFCRVHKNVPNRIVPYVLLVPTYGDTGFCWEPFNRYNRISSRGRIAIPMYPKDLKVAVLTAVADLRWQVAKEKASYYWMEEGLTGHYYQWIDSQKLKGDLKAFFIADYVLWMTKEAEGVQRLDKEVRSIFWRYIPFPQELKEVLKTRSLTYKELYQKDINRSMSDGY